MRTHAPPMGRIVVAIGFALSCFGLALFLWIAFGGPVPLRADSYRVTAYFPEASQLAMESEVRIGGVTVGAVKDIGLAPADRRVDGLDTTEAVIEIEPEFAPIASDARAILRQKTLLGETFIELTSGTEPEPQEGSAELDPGGRAADSPEDFSPVSLGPAARASMTDTEAASLEPIPEGGELATGQVQPAVQIDEIFNALDPETREAFRQWQANTAFAAEGRAVDLSDALGNLGPFLGDAAALLQTLERQEDALQGVVRDTGTVFEALTQFDQQLAGAIVNAEQTFDALASQETALAETIRILPTFERESRATFIRLQDFATNTRPLVAELMPVARDLSPTLASVRELTPELERLFPRLDQLITAGLRGFPALRRTLAGLRPLMRQLDPFLANLNPVISYLGYFRHTVTDFLSNPGAGLSGTLAPRPGQPSARHTLRQIGYLSPETVSMYTQRNRLNRGNAYKKPFALTNRRSARSGIWANFDCRNTGVGEVTSSPPVGPDFAPCYVQPDFPDRFGGERAPQIFADP